MSRREHTGTLSFFLEDMAQIPHLLVFTQHNDIAELRTAVRSLRGSAVLSGEPEKATEVGWQLVMPDCQGNECLRLPGIKTRSGDPSHTLVSRLPMCWSSALGSRERRETIQAEMYLFIAKPEAIAPDPPMGGRLSTASHTKWKVTIRLQHVTIGTWSLAVPHILN
ncbi:hypothetical protein C8035_v002705 [Colletotrichum spinosum]|uniref:Uncharacterized protein n=1 Tax=Colletotrichum spinosum TaxID=1347390 RepID=A0A4R8PXM8_9PEZI|nr:hypothetical protein C8035_v002705 [Colletotrichum spinosum]